MLLSPENSKFRTCVKLQRWFKSYGDVKVRVGKHVDFANGLIYHKEGPSSLGESLAQCHNVLFQYFY